MSSKQEHTKNKQKLYSCNLTDKQKIQGIQDLDYKTREIGPFQYKKKVHDLPEHALFLKTISKMMYMKKWLKNKLISNTKHAGGHAENC